MRECHTADSVFDSIVSQELLGVVGHVGQTPVTGQLHGDAVGGKILSEPLLQLFGAARAAATELDCWPTRISVSNDEVMVTSSLEII